MNVQVLVAVGISAVLVDADSATDQNIAGGPVLRMAVAPNGQFVACFNAEGKLLVRPVSAPSPLAHVSGNSCVRQLLRWNTETTVHIFSSVSYKSTWRASTTPSCCS